MTLDALREGTRSSRSAINNSIADRAAGRGHEAGCEATRDMFQYLAKKQQAYIVLLRTIQSRIVRVAQAVSEWRRAIADS